MSAVIIDGKSASKKMMQKSSVEVAILKEKFGITPSISVILVGNDTASSVYVKNKLKAFLEVGINYNFIHFENNCNQDQLLDIIHDLNKDSSVHGILVQLPLPKNINPFIIINAIEADKDVDGFNPLNVGKLVTSQEGLFPCTPVGCMKLIKQYLGDDIEGKKAVIVGCSNIVGRPLAQLLLQANCTITLAHSKTKNITDETKTADILIVATGNPGLVTKEWIKPGACVIDVGINRIIDENNKIKLVGDVRFDEVKELAGFITPVPGGVGPMTIACLIENIIKAYLKIFS